MLENLDPRKIEREIDEPAMGIAAAFQWPESARPTTFEFMEFIQRLVANLYSQATGLEAMGQPSDAYALAIACLDQHYPHSGMNGSEAALLDFLSARTGSQEAIKQALVLGYVSQRREAVIRALLVVGLGNDWSIRCNLTQAFLTLFRDHLPPEIANAKPAQLADSLENLLLTYARAQAAVRESFRNEEGARLVLGLT
ncbi:MAG: hypothetical protein AAB676_02630 [Verrucomicrobiota bacterium]